MQQAAQEGRQLFIAFDFARPFDELLISELYFRRQPFQQRLASFSESALPQDYDTPTVLQQLFGIHSVPLYILLELGFPSILVACWHVTQAASLMPMPEAALNKNYCPVLWQANIRSAGQSPNMQPITKSTGMKEASHFHFWLRILTFNPRHHSGAGLFIDYVSHSW